MFSLKKLFGKEDKFFDLLEEGADAANTSVTLLGTYLQHLASYQHHNDQLLTVEPYSIEGLRQVARPCSRRNKWGVR